MMSYDTIPVLFRILLMLGLFMVLCVSISLLIPAFRRRSVQHITSRLFCAVLSGSMMVLFAADVRSQKKELVPAAVSRWFCERPIVYVLPVLAVMVIFLTYSVWRELKIYRTTLTRSAIRESLDHLPTGLCFYMENGRAVLVNHRMNQLCHKILGHDLQDAAGMWEALCSGDVQKDVERLSVGSQPVFRLQDGTVWTFSRTDLQEIFQITAVDTTQLYGLARELEQKNAVLESLYQRLKQYEENVEELTRAQERLETKARIHSELGQALWASRSYLLHDTEEKAVPAELWKRSIALLQQNTADKMERFTLSSLVQTAAAFGITVTVDGQMPDEEEAGRLFLEAAAETLTNAVRHAGAQTLYCDFFETDTAYQVCFRNDGRQPENEITEGGGLGSLRRKVETYGGMMTICCQPEYILTIAIPKGWRKSR